jgi:hypothetical protein
MKLRTTLKKLQMIPAILRNIDHLQALLDNSPGIDFSAATDPQTLKTYDYPEQKPRIKFQVAQALCSALDYIQNSPVEGDIAEFGVGSGWTATVLSRASDRKKARSFHLFDSFEGLPDSTSKIDLNTPLVAAGVWGKGTCNWKMDPDILRRILEQKLPAEKINIYPGWFSVTLEKMPATTRFALAHVDCDLYQSTFDVLFALFSKRLLTPGGLLLFDDWFCNAANPEFGQQKAWHEIQRKFAIKFCDYGNYSHAGKRIIVHSYEPLNA